MSATITRRIGTVLAVTVLLTAAGCGDDDGQAMIRSKPVPQVERSGRSSSSGGSQDSDAGSDRDSGSDSSTNPDAEPVDGGPDPAMTMDEPFSAQPGPMTDEGTPSTFIAVTDDTYELVEIDSADGRVVRSLGSTGGDVEDLGNVIDGAWWHPATGVVVVSDGPEPAAGNLTLVEPGQDYVRGSGPDGWGMGWDVAISPDGRFALTTGYGADVSVLADGSDGRDVVVELVDNPGEDMRYHPAWLRDRVGVAMVREVDGARTVVDVIELGDDGQVAMTITHELDREIADLEVRSDGKLVVLYDDGRNPLGGGSRAGVIEPDSGEVRAEFDLEQGSHSLAYDATGRLLLYVDGEGTVRWQGAGDAGVLAEGYGHADW